MKTKQAIQTRKDCAHQNFQELLQSISKVSNHMIDDNEVSMELDSDFPLEIRKRQVSSLSSLIKVLEETLTVIEFNIDSGEDPQDELD